MASITLEGVSATYGSTPVFTGVDLVLISGELHTLLGPSGCGKTTLLRLIAGFLHPSSGRILVDGADITRLPPEKRHMGVVFQSYALFPNMTVAQNIAYGLRAAKTEAHTRERIVEEWLEIMGLQELSQRNAMELSGGQQQRVAIARALAPSPSVLLLDEPMANLDEDLRASLREEIKHIQQTTGVTTLYITHDQREALSVSDRISVMNKGVIEQTGTPHEIYENPGTRFVASFIGDINLIGDNLVRPEALKLEDHVSPNTWYQGRVAKARYLGFATDYTVEIQKTLAAPAPSSSVRVLMLNRASGKSFNADDSVWVESCR